MPIKPVPRENVPWYPTIELDQCDGCRLCLEYCRFDVYSWEEDRRKPLVSHPFGCVVGCSGCQPLCPRGAISFPDLDEIQDIIRKLRES